MIDVLIREEIAQPAWRIAELAAVDPDHATKARRRMTECDTDYPILRRGDLGPDWYEAVEDSARDWRSG